LLLGASLLVLVGCPSGTQGAAEDPTKGAQARRDTEMVHEECDLSASGAQSTDGNGDGSPDIVRVMKGGREICRAVDLNMDKVIDQYSYFDDGGQLRRRESGFDRDTRPDQISYYASGQIVRRERETNNDAKLDTWDYYKDGRLEKEERDSTGDGFVDQWWTFSRPDQPDCAIVVSDGDGDGKPDPDSQIDLCADGKTPPAKTLPKPDEPAKPDDGDSPSGESTDTAPPDTAPEEADGYETSEETP
jgi:hypothetical protein